LLNYCVRQINTGAPDYYEEILSLYTFLLEKQLLEQRGKLTQWTFINILTAGLRLKNYTWTEQFIRNYKSALAPDNQENVYAYSLASLYFEKGELDRALQLLQEVVFTDAFYQVAAKIIQLKIYYLHQEYDAFFSLSLATQRFLSRNRQLSAYQKKSNLNFLKIIKRLFQLKNKADYLKRNRYQEQLLKLKERIQNTDALGNRKWLVEAVDQLGK
jgi:tetratricopeptide (TPR) repeat protein